MAKIKCAILGSGNIGSDLMIKLGRSEILECVAVIGIDPQSDGLRRAKELGYEAIHTGIDGYVELFQAQPELKADILFDATSARAHLYNAKLCQEHGIKAIDMTPAAVGPLVSPAVNMEDHLDKDNINMITCGGQATIPMIHAINRVANVEYAEIVATLASLSAGPGTRANIDEFTETTSRAIVEVGGAEKGKAIIILKPC